MPVITIRLEVPDGVRVSVEGATSPTTGRTWGRDSAPPPRGGGNGEGDGSATEKQRKLVYARAKNAGVEVAALLATVGLESMAALGWKDVQAVVAVLDAGSKPPDTKDKDSAETEPEMPF